MPESKRANRMQQPPQEEGRTRAPQPMHNTHFYAHRLAAANAREMTARNVQVNGRTELLTRHTQKLSDLWLSLARHLEVRAVHNLERFVHAQYRYSVARGQTLATPPNAGTFKTEQAYDRYIEYNGVADKQMAIKLDTANMEFACCVGEAMTAFPDYNDWELWKYVLMNKMVEELSPLYRYCIAAAERIEEPRDKYQASAMEQFLMDPLGYSKMWGHMIPQSLKDDASVLLLFTP